MTFTKLPTPVGNIKIEEITLTSDQIKQTGSLSDKAYDITSDMKDGDFSYNLSLPIPESSKGKAVGVKFTEELEDIGSAEKVDNTLTKTDASISIESLDHFTIFVVTAPNPVNSDCSDSGLSVSVDDRCYNTIQEAIDDAAEGETINVAAGTYDEQVVIDGKNLTLQGVGDTTIIQPSAPTILTSTYTFPAGNFWAGATTSSIILVKNAGAVTIKDLKVDGINVFSLPLTGSPSRLVGVLFGVSSGTIDNVTVNNIKTTGYADRTYGIQVSGASTGTYSVEVKNSHVNDWARNGIVADGVNLTANINYNTLVGPGTISGQVANGILFIGGATGNATSNTISGMHYNAGSSRTAGILVYGATTAGILIDQNDISDTDDGIDLSASSHDATVSNNNLHNNLEVGIQLEDGTANNTITNNIIVDNTMAGIRFGGADDPIPAEADTPPGAGNVAHDNTITGTGKGIVNYDTGLGQIFDATNNWWGSAVLATVQSKVNDIAKVTVTPYYVNSGKTILSDTIPTTVYVDDSYTDGTADDHYFGYDAFTKIQDGITAVSSEGTVNVAAGTYVEQLTINKSLTLTGSGTVIIRSPGVMTTVNVLGIQAIQGVVTVQGSSPHGITVNINNLTIDNNYQTPASNATWLAGIVYSNADGSISGNTITKTKQATIDTAALRGHGIWIGDSSTVTADNNIISEFQRNGIEVKDANASATASNNNITCMTDAFTVENGINFYGSTGGSITGNTISGCRFTGAGSGNDFNNGTQAGAILLYDAVGTPTVTGNTVQTSDLGIYSRMVSGSSTISNNTVQNNLFGIIFRKGDSTVNGNTVTGGEVGILVPSLRTTTAITPSATSNSITGTTVFGLRNDAAYIVDATQNWWGDISGPTHATLNPNGIGDAVSNNVTFDPWYLDEGNTNLSDTIDTIFDDVSSALAFDGVESNIGDVTASNFTSFPSLYFEKRTDIDNPDTAVGKITFSSALDLSSNETQIFLEDLGNKMQQSSGHIALDVQTATSFANKGAALVMYNLPPDLTQGQLIVRNDDDTILNTSAVVPAGFSQDPITHDVTFDAAHFTQFDIDTTPPVIADHDPVTAEAASVSGATVTYLAPNATDNVDPITPASCSLVSGSTFALGNTTVTCNKTDTAGNTATPTTFTVTVQDTTKPENVTVSDSGTFTSNSHLTFTWPASTDSGSGISYYEFWLSSTAANESSALDLDTGSSNKWKNIGNVTSYTLTDAEAALLSTETQYFAKVKAVDNVGNFATTGSSSWSDGITLDTTAPVISFVDKTAPNVNGWNNSDVTVNWNCSDSGSGVVSSTVFQTLTGEGANQSSTGTCTNNAGNTASDTQTGINIDKTASATPAITTPVQTVNTDTIHIVGTAEADSTVTITGGASTATGTATGGNYDITVTLTQNVVNNLSVTATDAATNVSPAATVAITHDNAAPTVTNKLGNDSTDVVLSTGDTSLIFSKVLSDSSKTAVTNALTAGADKTLTYSWTEAALTITAIETTTFANDVVVNVSDLAGNTATSLLLVDSSLTTTQTTPDDDGAATADSDSPEVVITDPDQEVTVTVDGTTDATIDVSSFMDGGTGDVPQITINSDTADIAIPATTVTGPADWNGVIAAPTVTTVTLPETTGETTTLGTAIEIGFADAKLSFDNAVRILLPGQAGKKAGYSRPGTAFTEITSLCAADTQAAGDALGVDGECKIDAGADLVIWTKHFTKFASYTQTTNSTSTSSSTSSGGGTTSASAPVCSDTKPASAPVLLSAVSTGANSVILTWSRAANPVTYYLITFGLGSGLQQYGNPNVGGPDTTSYTVSGLSGGTTYYFKVRAGNGCAPGAFSNELSATPAGGVLTAAPEGFTAGVLGESTEEEIKATAEPAPTPEVRGTSTSGFNWWLLTIPGALLALFISGLLLRRRT